MQRRRLQPTLDDLLAEQLIDGPVYRPRRIYFDTAHYQDFSTPGEGSALFAECVDRGRLIPVLSQMHLVEIAKKGLETRRRIASFLAPYADRRRALWVQNASVLQNREWFRAAEFDGNGRLQDQQVFASDFREILTWPPVLSAALPLPPSLTVLIELTASKLGEEYLYRARMLSEAFRFSRERRQGLPRARRRYATGDLAARAIAAMPATLMDSPNAGSLLGKKIP
jgi:hypothetical protein